MPSRRIIVIVVILAIGYAVGAMYPQIAQRVGIA
jgi:hypothetical protein